MKYIFCFYYDSFYNMPSPRERRTTPLGIEIDGLQLSTSIDADSGTHYIVCHLCGDSITLTVTGHWHPRNFYNHINGSLGHWQCKRNLSKAHNNPSQSASIFHVVQTSSHYSSDSPMSVISSFSESNLQDV